MAFTKHILMEDIQVDVYLAKIRDEEKSFRSQISRVLVDLEKALFNGGKQLTQQAMEQLFEGIPEKKYKGLVALSGIPGKFGSGLKNSSHTSLALLLRLISSHPQKADLLDAFLQVDQDQLKELKLDIHISKGGAEKEVGFKVASYLKNGRPGLKISSYLISEKVQTMFAEWLKTTNFEPNPAAEMESSQLIDNGEELPEEEGENFADKQVQRKRMLEKLADKVDIYDQIKNNEYFLENFYDPFVQDISASVLTRQSIASATAFKADRDPRLLAVIEEQNLGSKVHMLHME